MFPFTKKQTLLLFSLFLCVFAVQFARIDRPYTGHFATYQGTVMGGIAQNTLRENFSNLLYPTTNSIVGEERSLHMNQFPLPAFIAAAGVRVFGGSLEFWGRFQAIGFNLFAVLLIGVLGKRIFNEKVGWIAVVLAAFSPFSMIYGQAFMSESSALCFFLLALVISLPQEGEARSWVKTISSGFLFSLVLISRSHWLVFYIIFAFIFLFLQGRQKILHSCLFVVTSLILPLAWYGHACYVGIHASNVHTSFYHQLAAQEAIDRWALFTSPAFYKEALKTYFGRIFTPVLVPAFFIGLVMLVMKLRRVFWILLLGLAMNDVLYLLVPQKVLQHDFYLYGCFPFLMLCSAYGIDILAQRYAFLRKAPVVAVAVLIYFLVSFRFFMNPIFTESQDEKHMVAIAALVKAKTEPDDKIIVLSQGPGVFGYYVERAVWNLQPQLVGKPMKAYKLARGTNESTQNYYAQLTKARENEITWVEYLRSKGADYIVVPLIDELDQMPALQRHLETLYQKISSPER